jgi:hypothetical protein
MKQTMKTKKHIKGAVQDRKKKGLMKPCNLKAGLYMIPKAVLMSNFYFTVQFDDENDCKEVIEALQKYINLTWNHDTKEAMIHWDKKTRTLLVSKSINKIPKPFRI